MAEETINDTEGTGTEGEGTTPKRKMPPLLSILTLGQTVFTLALGAAIVMGMQSLQKPHISGDIMKDRAIASLRDEAVQIQWLQMEPFVTNTRSKSTIKASLNVEVSDAHTAGVIQSRMPAIRARILNLLSQQDSKNLIRMQEKLLLKDALREVINQELQKAGVHKGVVRDVYLMDFLII
jgi:flagellar basal body-associated protein FliL